MSLARRVFWIKLLTILVLMGLWEGLSRSGLFYKGVLPSTWMVVQAIAGELADSGFYHDLGITMLETSVGFVAGAIIALLFALALGTNAYIRKMIEPYIIAIGGTPKIIFLPILFLIFGLGIESKMAKAALSAFFPIVLSATSGIAQIPLVLLRVGWGFDLSRWQMLTKIYLPAVTNPLLTGLRLGVAMAIIGVLSAEISYATAGLGYRLIRNADQFKISSVYAIIAGARQARSLNHFNLQRMHPASFPATVGLHLSAAVPEGSESEKPPLLFALAIIWSGAWFAPH
jgi:ABC-type nitrate/sulfonate/bicarbonate transport system permease component